MRTVSAIRSGVDVDAAASGSRDNPAALGTTVSSCEWAVTVNTVTLNATDAVMTENVLNNVPGPGMQYLLVNATIAYIGDNPDGAIPIMVGIDYVAADGTVVDGHMTFAVAPDPLDAMATLRPGMSVTGNLVYLVESATAHAGTIAVEPGLLSDNVFVTLQ